MRGRSIGNTTDSKCLQLLLLLLLLLRLLRRNLLLILDWYGWWRLHWRWRLRLLLLLLNLPNLCYYLLLMLLYHHLLLTIRICHRILRNVAVRVKSNTDAIWCSSAILWSWSRSWSLIAAGIIDDATAWRCGRNASRRRMAE